MSDHESADPGASRWPRLARGFGARGPRRGYRVEAKAREPGASDRSPAARSEDRPELQALLIQERAQTLRLGLCVIAAVLVVACLIPIANGRPRFRRPDGEGG